MIDNMSEEEASTWEKYKRSWGESYADACINRARTEKATNAYVEKHLKNVPQESKASMPYGRYRGYVKGSVAFERKDGQPITEEDIQHLNNLVYGQVTYCNSTPGEQIALVHYTCDSTD